MTVLMKTIDDVQVLITNKETYFNYKGTSYTLEEFIEKIENIRKTLDKVKNI